MTGFVSRVSIACVCFVLTSCASTPKIPAVLCPNPRAGGFLMPSRTQDTRLKKRLDVAIAALGIFFLALFLSKDFVRLFQKG